MLKNSIIFIILALGYVSSFAQTNLPVRLDDVFIGRSLQDTTQRAKVVKDLNSLQTQKREKAISEAKRQGKPTRVTLPGGRVEEVVDVTSNGNLVYLTTHNLNARISTAVSQAASSYSLDGTGMSVGVWDAGAARATHVEFQTNRVTIRDGAAADNHATHVAGTIAALGVNASALGMAPSAKIESFNWTSDLSEMAANASITGLETNKIKVSNHSYGYVRGWNWNGSRWTWNGFFGNSADSVDPYFGYYSSVSRSVDTIAYDAPYYLIFWSAGNDRSQNPSVGSPITIGGTNTTYNPAAHPAGDGVYMGGYELISDHATAKNVITVGAVNDAVLNGNRDVSRASMSTFSCWGPTDDGRVKPDLVGNGVSVFSPVASSDTSYASYNGTSMASPNVAGSALVLAEHYASLSGGQSMRASSLKGLLIHTADDLDNIGPDYKTGWGLVNAYQAATHLSDHFQNPAKKGFQEDALNATTPSQSYQIYSDGVSPLKFTISWTDPVGPQIIYADDITPTLVNDLNIKVVGPGGQTYYPYVMPFTTQWTLSSMASPATTGVNNRDNTEQIYIASPPIAGTYTIIVDHVGSLTNGEQTYSLFVSGASAEIPVPVISEIMGQSTPEDVALQNLVFTVTHPTLDNSQIIVSATSSNTQIVANENITISNSGSNYLLTAVPNPDQGGVTDITISANDGTTTVTRSFNYYVFEIDDPPVVSPIGDIQLYKNQVSNNIPLSIADVDSDLSILNFAFSSTNTDLLPEDSIIFNYDPSQGWFMVITPQVDLVGTAQITLYISDLDNTTPLIFNFNVVSPPPTFYEWAQDNGIDPIDPLAKGGDSDGDGLANVMEYFMGLNPNLKDQEGSLWQSTDATNLLFYYKKGKNTMGISGEVRWTSDLTSDDWTSEGLYDWLVSDHEGFELRCAQVPIPPGLSPVFMRIDLTID